MSKFVKFLVVSLVLFFSISSSFAQDIDELLAAMVEAKDWLQEEAICTVTLFNEQPIIVEPPNFVNLKIV